MCDCSHFTVSECVCIKIVYIRSLPNLLQHVVKMHRWLSELGKFLKFVHMHEQTHTHTQHVMCARLHICVWMCSLCWSGVMFTQTWPLNQSYIRRLMHYPDGKGQLRGALCFTPPPPCLIAGKNTLLVPRQKEAAQWRLCLSSYDGQRAKFVCERQTDSAEG